MTGAPLDLTLGWVMQILDGRRYMKERAARKMEKVRAAKAARAKMSDIAGNEEDSDEEEGPESADDQVSGPPRSKRQKHDASTPLLSMAQPAIPPSQVHILRRPTKWMPTTETPPLPPPPSPPQSLPSHQVEQPNFFAQDEMAELQHTRRRSAMQLFFEESYTGGSAEDKLRAWFALTSDERAEYRHDAGELDTSWFAAPRDGQQPQSFRPAFEREKVSWSQSRGGKYGARAMATTFAIKNVIGEDGERKESLVRDQATLERSDAFRSKLDSGVGWRIYPNGALQSTGGSEYLFEPISLTLDEVAFVGTAWPCYDGFVGCFPLGYIASGVLTMNLAARVRYAVRLEILNGGARPLFSVTAVEQGVEPRMSIQRQSSDPAKVLMMVFDDIYDSPFISQDEAIRFWGWDSAQVQASLRKLGRKLEFFRAKKVKKKKEKNAEWI